MTGPHDTPEAVERHAEHLASCYLPGTAAMLRRLHQRAIDAERELIEQARAGNALFRRFQAERDEARAALATARADALRERDENHRAWRDSVSQSDDLRLQRDEARAHYNDVLAENDALRFERNNLAASLSTARADALREAVDIADAVSRRASHSRMRAVEDCHTSEIHHQEGRWHAANDIGEDIAILAAKPTTTGET